MGVSQNQGYLFRVPIKGQYDFSVTLGYPHFGKLPYHHEVGSSKRPVELVSSCKVFCSRTLATHTTSCQIASDCNTF